MWGILKPTTEKRRWEAGWREVSWTDHWGWMGWHNSVALWWLKGLHLVCKSSWDSIIAPFRPNGYLGLHKARVGSAEDESTSVNGVGSTDLEITTSFVWCQPCNSKDGTTMKEGRHLQQSCALRTNPASFHPCSELQHSTHPRQEY